MTSSNLVVRPSIPLGSIPHSVSSASKHIIKGGLQRFYPESQVTYSPTSNNELSFHITSPNSMWDPMTSYIRFKLNVTLNNNAVNETSKYLSEGGVHALFERIEIYTRGGVLIERIDDYNKLYAIMSAGSASRKFVDQSCGDEADSGEPYVLGAESSIQVNYATATYTSGTRTFAALAGAAFSQIVPGDKLAITYAVGGIPTAVEVEVTSIASDDSFLVRANSIPTLGAGAIIDISYSDKVMTSRQMAANTANYDVCFTPYSPFLSNSSYVPLQLIRGGLRVVFTLSSQAAYSIVSRNPSVGAGFSGADFVISNPEWMCQLYQADESLNAKMLEMYKSGGLHYMYPIYRKFSDTIEAGGQTSSLNHHVNMRSVRTIYQRIQDIRANTVSSGAASGSLSTYNCDSIAQGLKDGLQEYQYTVGSLRFPDSSPTKLTSVSNAEALKEFKRSMGQMGAVNVFDKRFLPCEWRSSGCKSVINESGGLTDSQRLVLSAVMARDPSPFSGVDASLANIQSELLFGAGNGSKRYVHTWVEADCVLSIGEDGIVRRS